MSDSQATQQEQIMLCPLISNLLPQVLTIAWQDLQVCGITQTLSWQYQTCSCLS